MEEVQRVLEDYLAVRRVSSTTTRYLQAFRRVSREAPELIQSIRDPPMEMIRGYLASLERDGKGASTIRFYYFFLKSLTERVMRGNWPYKKWEAPPGAEEFTRPILNEEQIRGMIVQMKGCPDLAIRTRFAVSTIYGARRVELGDLGKGKGDISLESGTIRIKTRKHGDVRTHLIPNEIKPHLFPDSLEPLSPSAMSDLFKRIEENYCGLNHKNGYGWHSIRRRLATWFDDHDVSREDIYRFMRWKRRREILDVYIVRTETETAKKLAEVDQRIFKVHPFLSAWGD